MVMEILEGSTLRETPGLQKCFPPARVLSVLRDVCAALTVAHRRHLVHRDLKPENIFLMTTEPRKVAKVLDFGIAKFLSNSPQQPTQHLVP
jgi:serine/threonine protein kinase